MQASEYLKSGGQYLKELRSLVERMRKLEDRLDAKQQHAQCAAADTDLLAQKLLADKFRVLNEEDLDTLE